jgi:hypothetical protein
VPHIYAKSVNVSEETKENKTKILLRLSKIYIFSVCHFLQCHNHLHPVSPVLKDQNQQFLRRLNHLDPPAILNNHIKYNKKVNDKIIPKAEGFPVSNLDGQYPESADNELLVKSV